LIRIFTFLGGIYFFLYFVLPESVLTTYGVKAHHEQISNGFIAIGAMALGLGLFNIIRGHGASVVFRRAGWSTSLALLVGLFATVVVTSAQWVASIRVSREVRAVQILGEFAAKLAGEEGTAPSWNHDQIEALYRVGAERSETIGKELEESARASLPEAQVVLAGEVRSALATFGESLEAIRASEVNRATLVSCSKAASSLASAYSILRRFQSETTVTQSLYNLLYDGLFNQLGSAMFALLGVYIAAAAYRAFRVQTFESALMMTAAVVVMLGQISFGRALYEGMSDIRQWLLEVPNSAAFRAIRLGAGVAGLMLAIRMWLSIESASFSSEKKR
jgi:hypothetical protein